MWLLDQSTTNMMEYAYVNGFIPSPEVQNEYTTQQFGYNVEATPRILNINNGIASITINGVMTQGRDFIAMLFGGGNTTYSDIIRSVMIAENNDDVKSIDYNMNTPGGHFEGLIPVLDVMSRVTKPTRAIVDKAASAGYAIASQADKIIATSEGALVGSIGSAADFFVSKNQVTITSTKAPYKRPDPTTDEGKAVVRKTIDPMHDIFVERVAKGRNVSVDKVNNDFGKGIVILAKDAKQIGMIDDIQNSPKSIEPQQSQSIKPQPQPELKTMDINELKLKHPEIYSAIHDLGFKAGVAAELDRVSAHLTMGEACNAVPTAIKAIKDGEPMTAKLTAEYNASAVKTTMLKNRQDDDIDPGEPAGDDPSMQSADVVSKVCANLGVM